MAQVWKKGWDLHRKTAFYALLWRRSTRHDHICAKITMDLRQQQALPAPPTSVTCANDKRHLHHGRASPAPWTVHAAHRVHRIGHKHTFKAISMFKESHMKSHLVRPTDLSLVLRRYLHPTSFSPNPSAPLWSLTSFSPNPRTRGPLPGRCNGDGGARLADIDPWGPGGGHRLMREAG